MLIEPRERSLAHWIALCLAPGLISDVVSVFATLTMNDHHLRDLGTCLVLISAAAPLFAFPDLIMLGLAYTRSPGAAIQSTLVFVLAALTINALVWGAGCSLIWANFRLE
jgi:hypothetical protein